MKKLLSLLLVVMLMLPAAMAEEATLVSYASDFTAGTDGWYARSNGSASIEAANGCLTITGRESAWNSPGRNFALQAGKKYQISVQVLQSSEASIDFMISAAHSRDGVESYENLGKASAPKGCWVTIKADYEPGPYDNYILYVETTGTKVTDFMIRNFKIDIAETVYDPSLASLKELYAPYFDFGVALNQAQVLDAERLAFSAGQFAIMTHENELKPDSVLNVTASKSLAKEDETAVAVKFNAAKPLLDYCKANGIKVHGHVLFWHSQTPEAFFHEGYDANKPFVTREVMLARMDNYVRLVLAYMEENYPGVVVSWDVVNEAVSDNSVNLRESNWTKVVGNDWVNRAFEIAHKYASDDVLLYYNDYSTPYEPKQTGICNLLDSLIADGTIDGYGFQCHYSTSTPAPSAVRSAMQRIASKGLLLRVSELDIGVKSQSDAEYALQAQRFGEFVNIFMDYADQMEAVQVWGLSDDRSWRTGEYPLLFDERCVAKPAFHTLVELAENAAK